MPDVLDDERQRALIAAPTLDWSRLRAHLAESPEAVTTVLDRRFEALFEAGSQDRLWAEICEPAFASDALLSPAVAAPVMRALGAMVWYTPDAARVHTSLRASAQWGHYALVQRVDAELAVAFRTFQARATGHLSVVRGKQRSEFPDELIRMFADRSLCSYAFRAKVVRDVRARLDDLPLFVLHCEKLAWVDPGLTLTIVQRLATEAPRDRETIGHLPDGIHRELGERLAAIRPQNLVRRLGEIAGAGANGLASANLIVRAAGAADDNPKSPDYVRRVRFELARVMADLGVPLHVVLAWVAANRRRARPLDRHSNAMQTDRALQLFGVIATVLHAYHTDNVPEATGASPYR